MLKARIRHCQHRKNSERCTSDTSLQENASLLILNTMAITCPKPHLGAFSF